MTSSIMIIHCHTISFMLVSFKNYIIIPLVPSLGLLNFFHIRHMSVWSWSQKVLMIVFDNCPSSLYLMLCHSYPIWGCLVCFSLTVEMYLCIFLKNSICFETIVFIFILLTRIWNAPLRIQGFPYSSVSKESACNAGDLASISGSGRFPGEGNDNPLQCSYLENPMDKRA